MGSRGRGSGAGGGKVPKSIDKAKDFDGLQAYMGKHGVTLGESTRGMDLGILKTVAGEVEFIAKEFPNTPGIKYAAYNGDAVLNAITGNEKNAHAYASASFHGDLNLNPQMMNADVQTRYEHDVRAGFHPAGTTSANIATHELGHTLEAQLVHKKFGTYWDRSHAWNHSTVATQVVAEAARMAKRTPEGKGLTNDQLVAQISRYAMKNRSEALAEAVSDYRANGAKAKPLSRAIWTILKRELG